MQSQMPGQCETRPQLLAQEVVQMAAVSPHQAKLYPRSTGASRGARHRAMPGPHLSAKHRTLRQGAQLPSCSLRLGSNPQARCLGIKAPAQQLNQTTPVHCSSQLSLAMHRWQTHHVHSSLFTLCPAVDRSPELPRMVLLLKAESSVNPGVQRWGRTFIGKQCMPEQIRLCSSSCNQLHKHLNISVSLLICLCCECNRAMSWPLLLLGLRRLVAPMVSHRLCRKHL